MDEIKKRRLMMKPAFFIDGINVFYIQQWQMQGV